MKLALSPMATLTHEALRVLIHRYGDPDEYFSEMIHAPSFLAGGKYESWFVRAAPCPERMVWQLTGGSADPMILAAERLLPLGGIGIDLNMGCSAPDIARFGAGIAWMSKPLDEVAGLVGGVRRMIDQSGRKARLSVKLRLGEDEDYDRLLSFCRMLVNEGTETITLHPRTRHAKMGRPALHAYVARLASDLTVPVYGNGDIMTADDALSYMQRTPCEGLMIGRAAVQKPWIFADIRRAEDEQAAGQPAVADKKTDCNARIDHLEVARFFLAALAESQPPDFQITRARRFFFYYCDNFSFAHYIKMKIQNAETVNEIVSLLEGYFTEIPGDRYFER